MQSLTKGTYVPVSPPCFRRVRAVHTAEFKAMVVRAALLRPAYARIKPVCRDFPNVTPVQLRRWIRKSASTPEDDEGDDQWALYNEAVHGLLLLHYMSNFPVRPSCVLPARVWWT